MSEKAIGFIGVGNMGGTIASILLRSQKLAVFDLNQERCASLAENGAEVARSVAELAARSDVLFTCLPRSEDVEAVLFGPSGAASTLRSPSIVIDMTTGDPAITRSLAERLARQGVAFVDASLAGGTDGALAGTLAIYVGADPATFQTVRPVLESIAKKVLLVGPTGCGNLMKLINNVIGSAIRAITCEAVLMGVVNGLDLGTVAEILPKGSARSHFAETALPRYIQGIYKANFASSLMTKDLRLAMRIGREAHVPMQITELVLSLYETMVRDFGAACDVDRMLEFLEREAGTKISGQLAAA